MKTVIEKAREIWSAGDVYIGPSEKTLELFAELVRADERNSWPAEMVAMERQVNILTDALAEHAPVQQEPVGIVKDLFTNAAWDKLDVVGSTKVYLDFPPAQQEPLAWVPYLSDRADGVSGHYAIVRWNPRGYREVWNLRRHAWGAYSDDVLSLEEADTLLRLIEIPTRKVETPKPAQQEPVGYFKAEPFGWTDCAETDDGAIALYTAPQAQPAREPLTDEQIHEMANDFEEGYVFLYRSFARAIEAAHGIEGKHF